MDKKLNKKLSALDPLLRKKIENMFETIHDSISLLYDAVTHDEKTRLYNNKFFDNILDMEIEKAKRGKQKFSLIIIDIDYFKKINDTCGHIKADELLVVLAELLQKHIRKSDIVARFGGEEFVILLSGTDIDKAKKFALRLQKAVHSNKFLKKHNLTISGGIAEFRKKDTKKTIKQRADSALYNAKGQGRDRFIAVM